MSSVWDFFFVLMINLSKLWFSSLFCCVFIKLVIIGLSILMMLDELIMIIVLLIKFIICVNDEFW